MNCHCTSTDRTIHPIQKIETKTNKQVEDIPSKHDLMHQFTTKKKENSMAVQLVVSTLCNYRLISLKQVTRLLKKEQWVYKLRNSSDLKYLPVLGLFLMEHHRKKTSIFAVIQHATDPKEQSSRQFVSFFSIGINACVYFFMLGPYMSKILYHICPKVHIAQPSAYLNCCSWLRRRRCLQRITGSSLATTCGPLVLQENKAERLQW